MKIHSGTFSRVRRLWAPVFLTACAAFLQAAPSVLESLEIVPSETVSFASPTHIPLEGNSGLIRADLEVGDSLDGLILRLHPKKGVHDSFVVEQSFETSLTVMQEGPHLDLLNWKHYYAPWVPLQKLGPNEFRIARISEKDAQKFPAVTPKEIRAIVTREGGAGLGKYVSKVKGPNDYPCAVGVSAIRFRIKHVKDGKETVIRTVQFSVPMGC
jgi:hypothetical protein